VCVCVCVCVCLCRLERTVEDLCRCQESGMELFLALALHIEK